MGRKALTHLKFYGYMEVLGRLNKDKNWWRMVVKEKAWTQSVGMENGNYQLRWVSRKSNKTPK